LVVEADKKESDLEIYHLRAGDIPARKSKDM
jgi:hypothetical protein